MNNGETIIAGIPASRIIEQQDSRREAIREANATPLPGPLADAFALSDDIKVGTYSVRAVCDGDFELLQLIEHPIYKATFGSGTFGNDAADVRGLKAWQLCYLLTRPFDEAEGKLKEGRESFDAAAKAEFSKYRLPALVDLMKAVFQQINIYWSPSIGYQEPELETNEKDSSKKN